MSEEIPISVVMSVYNGERYLPLAIESVLKQTFKDFEFIIVDDGSTDRSLEIIRKYEKNDSRIRVLVQENHGLAAALNNGIAMAKGKYIARMDDDDISLPNRFELQYGFMESHPEIIASGGAAEIINQWGDAFGIRRHCTTHDEIDFSNIAYGNPAMCHPTALIRTDSLKKVGCYTPGMRYAQDLDLWLRLGEVGKLANLTDIVLLYRSHDKSATGEHRNEQVEFVKTILAEARRRRNIPNGLFPEPSTEKVVMSEVMVLLETSRYQLAKGRRFCAIRYAIWLFLKSQKTKIVWKTLYNALFSTHWF